MSECVDADLWLAQGYCPERRLRLFCFSQAGGDASAFHSWQAGLAPQVQVCAVRLPGRGSRFFDTPYTSLLEPVPLIAEAIAVDRRTPFWFFGHSMGALMAYEVARHLTVRGMPRPSGLLLSGCAAPNRLSPHRQRYALDDDSLIETLRISNMAPPELLGNRELMRLMLPTLRADFSMVDTYDWVEGPLLPVNIEVFAARSDPFVDADGIDGWAGTTSGSCRVHWFEGDHAFVNSQRDAVVQQILSRMLNATCRDP